LCNAPATEREFSAFCTPADLTLAFRFWRFALRFWMFAL
jgi:hypothetical protein